MLLLFWLTGAPPGPPLPRQVLPRDRSYMDKLFESLVGDGPQNRYALICKYCQSHNGMALPEEFEYLGMSQYCYTNKQLIQAILVFTAGNSLL